MKATVDIPDALYRRVKARSAMEGRAVRDVTIELYEHWLEGTSSPAVQPVDPSEAAAAWLSRWDELGEEIARNAVDRRSSREILVADRR